MAEFTGIERAFDMGVKLALVDLFVALIIDIDMDAE